MRAAANAPSSRLGCAGCHGLTSAANPKAKPVSQWQTLNDPLALIDGHVESSRADAGANPQRKAPIFRNSARRI